MEVLFPIGALMFNKKTKQSGRVVDNFVDTTDPNDVYLGSYIQLDNKEIVDTRDANEWIIIPDIAKGLANALFNELV